MMAGGKSDVNALQENPPLWRRLVDAVFVYD